MQKKSDEQTRTEVWEDFDLVEEKRIREKLNEYLEDEEKLKNKATGYQLSALKRLRTKLELRNKKRNSFIKLFDIDSYTNELIDREKANKSYQIKKEALALTSPFTGLNNPEDNGQDGNADVIYERKTLKTNISEKDSSVEIIEITRILDRFKNEKFSSTLPDTSQNEKQFYYLNQMPIGCVENRNDDIKCILSPFTNKMLKPYIWRDYKSLPTKLQINSEIVKRCDSIIDTARNEFSIDYVHLRPEHVLPINVMCKQHFWNGIDISECLQYPDFTVVALYRKLIIGFAFLVPVNPQPIKEMYLSFILVHPDWREWRCSERLENISIGKYMLFYLIQTSNNYDITLHVSVNSPAVLFYQKFGFKIEEFIQNFYDKYYSNDYNISKDAFLMKLSK